MQSWAMPDYSFISVRILYVFETSTHLCRSRRGDAIVCSRCGWCIGSHRRRLVDHTDTNIVSKYQGRAVCVYTWVVCIEILQTDRVVVRYVVAVSRSMSAKSQTDDWDFERLPSVPRHHFVERVTSRGHSVLSRSWGGDAVARGSFGRACPGCTGRTLTNAYIVVWDQPTTVRLHCWIVLNKVIEGNACSISDVIACGKISNV